VDGGAFRADGERLDGVEGQALHRHAVDGLHHVPDLAATDEGWGGERSDSESCRLGSACARTGTIVVMVSPVLVTVPARVPMLEDVQCH
jgi:hypothetical protein